MIDVDELIQKHKDTNRPYITSWMDFLDIRIDEMIPDEINCRQVIYALNKAVKEGKLVASWTGVGTTPLSGSAHRARIWEWDPPSINTKQLRIETGSSKP